MKIRNNLYCSLTALLLVCFIAKPFTATETTQENTIDTLEQRIVPQESTNTEKKEKLFKLTNVYFYHLFKTCECKICRKERHPFDNVPLINSFEKLREYILKLSKDELLSLDQDRHIEKVKAQKIKILAYKCHVAERIVLEEINDLEIFLRDLL